MPGEKSPAMPLKNAKSWKAVLGGGVLAVAIAVGVAGPAGAQPICFGIPATGGPTAGNDVIVGTPGPDVIDGRSGNDAICGLGGDDIIEGGIGGDRIDGGEGFDTIVGDTLLTSGDATTTARPDLLRGGDGPDNITGDNRSDNGSVSGAASDRIDGGPGDDGRLVGDSSSTEGGNASGAAADVIAADSGTGQTLFIIGDSDAQGPGFSASGNNGHDFIDFAEENFGTVWGDNFAAETASGGGHDRILGGPGDDNEFVAVDGLVGDNRAGVAANGGGQDSISGLTGDDTLWGDSVVGGALQIGGPLTGRILFPGVESPNGTTDRCDGGPGTDNQHNCEVLIGIP
jgi:Ca2+-binding RTX toxin-like protein